MGIDKKQWILNVFSTLIYMNRVTATQKLHRTIQPTEPFPVPRP